MLDLPQPLDTLLPRLRRHPDIEARELVAVDATDRYLLAAAAPRITAAPDRPVLVVDDTHGALALGAATLGATDVRVWQDALVAEHTLAENAGRTGLAARWRQVAADELGGAALVLMQLPRSLELLDLLDALLVADAPADQTVLAGARVKHMTHAMTDMRAGHHETVRATLARGKSRLLVATGPRAASAIPGATLRAALTASGSLDAPEAPAPDAATVAPGVHPDGTAIAPLAVRAWPGTFAGATLDIGTRAALPHVAAAARAAVARATEAGHAPVAVDLGCGSGLIAVELARSAPGLAVVATDQSRSAVASTRATARANRVAERVTVRRDLLLHDQPDASVDLVVCNPPFHVGAAVHTGVAHAMFADAARTLRPGGVLLTVFNSHLHHRPALERLVGPTTQVTRTPKFTVTLTERRHSAPAP